MPTHRNIDLGRATQPPPPEFMHVSRQVKQNISAQIARCLWEAYDLLKKEMLREPFRNPDDYLLECSITEELESRVHDTMSGEEPFRVQHECREWESCLPDTTRPPQYDIAFVLRANSRAKWPVEAKVLRTPGQVAAYVADLNEQFLTCRYAPRSSEGAMLGYLLSGTPDAAFAAISAAVSSPLVDYAEATGRSHKTSDHVRTVSTCKNSPAKFRCHHLIMVV